MSAPSLTPAAQSSAEPQPTTARRWSRTRHAFSLFSLYWTSKDWKFAWFALIVLIAITLTDVYLSVWMVDWERRFFDSVEQREVARFLPLLGLFAVIFFTQIAVGLLNEFLSMSIGLRWRVFLTERYLNRWFARDRFYEIERLNLIDNPDQRISEDIRLFTAEVLGLITGILSAAVSSVIFAMVLLVASDAIEFSLMGLDVYLPGDIVWYAAIYAIGGSVAIIYIGKPFVRRTMKQQHYEADFRSGMYHVRRNAPQISFARSQPTEKRSLNRQFDTVQNNYLRLIGAQLAIMAGEGIYQRLGSFMPLFLTVPRYFAGRISFGDVMATNSAFGQMSMSLSYFISVYSVIGEQLAYVSRLKALDDALDSGSTRGIAFSVSDQGSRDVGADDKADEALRTHALRINRPTGAPLVDIGDWTVRKGERWVIQGASGVGKSTLLRAIAGLWPDGEGEIALGRHGLLMFVPQRLYLPHASLKDAICFPDEGIQHDDDAILDILERVRMTEHRHDLHEVRLWQDLLSPGEQQRLALARILVHRPDMLVVDEATSALDADNAHHFYQTVLAQCPDLTLVSVIHDDRLVPYHTHRLTLADGTAEYERLENDA